MYNCDGYYYEHFTNSINNQDNIEHFDSSCYTEKEKCNSTVLSEKERADFSDKCPFYCLHNELESIKTLLYDSNNLINYLDDSKINTQTKFKNNFNITDDLILNEGDTQTKLKKLCEHVYNLNLYMNNNLKECNNNFYDCIKIDIDKDIFNEIAKKSKDRTLSLTNLNNPKFDNKTFNNILINYNNISSSTIKNLDITCRDIINKQITILSSAEKNNDSKSKIDFIDVISLRTLCLNILELVKSYLNFIFLNSYYKYKR
jgi:hypothetical protein